MTTDRPSSHPAAARPDRAALTEPSDGADGLGRWILLCAAAEAVGMTAAASAAKVADTLLGEPSDLRRLLAWLAVLVAGMTEAVALGLAQSVVLRVRIAGLRATRFVVTTVVVAGAFWAVASVPSLTGTPSGGASSQPPWPLVLLAGAALGVTAGVLLGGAQTLTFRSQVRRPWVWVLANVVAWTIAMPIIMLGATAPSADWPLLTLLGWAGLTGLLAGAALGAVLGWFAPSLRGTAPHNRVVLTLLRRGRPRRLTDSLVGLGVTGRRTGQHIRLPVMYVEADGVLWVAVGRSRHKTWWRNLGHGSSVEVLRRGSWRPAVAELTTPDDGRYHDGLAAYAQRWPGARLGPDDPLVRITEEGDR